MRRKKFDSFWPPTLESCQSFVVVSYWQHGKFPQTPVPMNSKRLGSIALLEASKRLGSARARGHLSVFRQLHQAKCRHLGSGQLRQEINALGFSTFHEYDLHGRETCNGATPPISLPEVTTHVVRTGGVLLDPIQIEEDASFYVASSCDKISYVMGRNKK